MGKLEALPRRTDMLLLPIVKQLVKLFPNVHPNWYTILRMILIVPMLFLMLGNFYAWGFVLFIFGAALDLLDGPVARYTKKTSRSGAYLDPLADKLLFMTVLVVFVANIHIFLFCAILALEISLIIEHSIKFVYFHGQDDDLRKNKQKSNIWGKVKFASEMVAMSLLFFWHDSEVIVYATNFILGFAVVLAMNSFYNHLKVYGN